MTASAPAPAEARPSYWARLKAHIVHPELTPNQVGWSFGLGLSVAFNPILGLHLALVVTLCFLFKGLHRPLMLAASFINNPWTSVPIATGTAYFGNILMGRGLDLNMEAVHWGSIGLKSFTTQEGARAMFTMLKPILAPYLVGGFLLSLLAIPVGYLLMSRIARRLRHLHALAHHAAAMQAAGPKTEAGPSEPE